MIQSMNKNFGFWDQTELAFLNTVIAAGATYQGNTIDVSEFTNGVLFLDMTAAPGPLDISVDLYSPITAWADRLLIYNAVTPGMWNKRALPFGPDMPNTPILGPMWIIRFAITNNAAAPCTISATAMMRRAGTG